MFINMDWTRVRCKPNPTAWVAALPVTLIFSLLFGFHYKNRWNQSYLDCTHLFLMLITRYSLWNSLIVTLSTKLTTTGDEFENLCSFLSLFSCLFSLFSFMFHECSVSNITIYVTYVLIRTFVGTNLNPLWEKFLVPSEGKDCMELNYQLHKRILCFFFIKKKKKGKKSDLYCLQRVASSHPY